MKEIKLTRGYFAIVDDSDYDSLSEFNWSALVTRNAVYAERREWDYENKKTVCIYMHRQILGCKERVDHKDGNGLNNQRKNLRPSTHAKNIANSRKHQDFTSSKYKGVSYFKANNNWSAYISPNGKKIHLGYFSSEYQAALAYNFAAAHYYGEFSRLNPVSVQ